MEVIKDVHEKTCPGWVWQSYWETFKGEWEVRKKKDSMHRPLSCKGYLNNRARLLFSLWILIRTFVLDIQMVGRRYMALKARETERMESCRRVQSLRRREKGTETSPLKSKKIRRDSPYSQRDCSNSGAFLFYRDVGNGVMGCGVHC